MSLSFTKMHGLGNDFMVVRSHGQPVPDAERIRHLADRHLGVGFDQLLWIEPARQPDAAAAYRIFNADGGEVEQCGNGARCVAAIVGAEQGRDQFLLEHPGGLSRARLIPGDGVAIDMGEPDFQPSSLPFIADHDADSYNVDVDGERVELRVVSMGNPHAVIFVDSVETAPVERLGPLLETHERFPNRANIGFVELVSPGRIRLRVFERGVGETRACGTGACAAVAVGRRAGTLEAEVHVALPGGEVIVSWEGPGKPVWLTGEAVTVFEGTIDS